jgi:hypothetical protein
MLAVLEDMLAVLEDMLVVLEDMLVVLEDILTSLDLEDVLPMDPRVLFLTAARNVL